MTTKVEITKIHSDLTDIKVAVGKIEQHLSDMNGKLLKHSKFIETDCPLRRQDMHKKIERMFWTNIGGWAVLSAVVVALLTGLI